MAQKRKLLELGMRLLWLYIIQFCFDLLGAITCQLNTATRLQLSVVTARRYVRKMDIVRYVAIEKDVSVQPDASSRIQWSLKLKDWKLID